MIHKRLFALCLLAAALAGCDQLGIETPDKVAARQEAEGKAVGGACRHSGRALEECYEMNRRAPKAAIYAGWRDMDAYMRDNNIASVKPAAAENETAPAPSAKPEAKAEAKTEGSDKKAAASVPKPAEHKAIDSAPADKAAKAPTKTS